MSKVKVKIKKTAISVRVKTEHKEIINESELNQLTRINPRGIMHITSVKKGCAEYSCPAVVSLTERLKKNISRYDFFFMMEQIVIMVQDVCDSGLNINSVRFNPDEVYINEMTKEMYFIYFPLVSGQDRADIVSFIENIIYSITPVINEDTDYISRFMYYVRSFHGFNGNAIEKYITREERAVVNVLRNMEMSGIGQQGTTVLAEDSMMTLQPQQIPQPQKPMQYHFASLTRQVTGEKIELNKPSFVLGKSPESADYAIADNTNVSRIHATIITRNGRYYVMDQRSTNGTFVNGRIIKPNQEVELLTGDCLMLANEEFVFGN
ncbi:FHA domain-containing protein [Agathobacter sp.]